MATFTFDTRQEISNSSQSEIELETLQEEVGGGEGQRVGRVLLGKKARHTQLHTD